MARTSPIRHVKHVLLRVERVLPPRAVLPFLEQGDGENRDLRESSHGQSLHTREHRRLLQWGGLNLLGERHRQSLSESDFVEPSPANGLSAGATLSQSCTAPKHI